MSDVRMCDKCGRIFKAGIEGSSTGQMTLVKKDDRNRPAPETIIADYCPTCTGGGGDVEPRVLSITGGSKNGDKDALFVDDTTEVM